MPTLEASGTQAASIGTEHTLSTLNTNKVFVLVVDANAMAAGDALELRVKTKTLSGGVTRTAYMGAFWNEQEADDKIKISIPIPSDQEFIASLKQIAGTGRSFPWKILSI